MNEFEFIKNYTRYNVWANKKLITVIDETIASEKTISSFNSIKETFFHIWNAEKIWMLRMQNQHQISWPPLPTSDEKKFDEFMHVSEEFNDWVSLKTNDFFLQSCAYKNSKGEAFSQTNAQIIMHCMNHSTFHRGQIITMLRTLGRTNLPSTDLITFYREI